MERCRAIVKAYGCSQVSDPQETKKFRSCLNSDVCTPSAILGLDSLIFGGIGCATGVTYFPSDMLGLITGVYSVLTQEISGRGDEWRRREQSFLASVQSDRLKACGQEPAEITEDPSLTAEMRAQRRAQRLRATAGYRRCVFEFNEQFLNPQREKIKQELENALAELGIILGCYQPQYQLELVCRWLANSKGLSLLLKAAPKIIGRASGKASPPPSSPINGDSVGLPTRFLESCPECPRTVTFTSNTVEHSQTHFLNLGKAQPRAGKSTTLFPEEVKIERVIAEIQNQPDWKRVLEREASREVVSFETAITLDNKYYEVRILVCRSQTCASSRGGSFRQGDVISIVPRCGPGVLLLKAKPGNPNYSRLQPCKP